MCYYAAITSLIACASYIIYFCYDDFSHFLENDFHPQCMYMYVFAACFSVHVRGSEYIPLLGSADADYPMLGLPDFEQ